MTLKSISDLWTEASSGKILTMNGVVVGYLPIRPRLWIYAGKGSRTTDFRTVGFVNLHLSVVFLTKYVSMTTKVDVTEDWSNSNPHWQ